MSKPKGLNFDRLMTPILLFFEIFVTLQTSFQCIVFSETIKKNTHKNQCIKRLYTFSTVALVNARYEGVAQKQPRKNILLNSF